MEEEKIFNKLENIIKNVEIDNYNIYNTCNKEEKLKVTHNSNNSLSFKIFKNFILLKFNNMKTINDTIEIRVINDIQLQKLKSRNEQLHYNSKSNYVKIAINNISDIDKYSEHIIENFKYFFKKYMDTEEQFGCCSKYVECSNALQCINNDIRSRLACLYKRNLDKNKIFYGKNKNR